MCCVMCMSRWRCAALHGRRNVERAQGYFRDSLRVREKRTVNASTRLSEAATRSATKCVEAAPVELRRARAEIRARRPGEATLRSCALARFDRLGRLAVQQRGDGRGAALVADREHFDDTTREADRELDLIAPLDLPRRLRTRAVHVHASADHRVGRSAARLVEARGPEPLVDAHATARP